MQVILLEKIERLGQMGDVVTVKPGYARNFLLPKEKALRATKSNIAYFDGQKKQLVADNEDRKKEAEKLAKKVDGITIAIIRQASEGGQLYGSVSSRDIATEATAVSKVDLDKSQVRLDCSYKMLGLYPVKIKLHPEVSAEITINIARSTEEAKLQEEKGGALTSADEEESLVEAAIEAVKAEEESK